MAAGVTDHMWDMNDVAVLIAAQEAPAAKRGSYKKRSMTVLDELIRLGFEPVTEWVTKGDRIAPRSFDWKDHGGWLYAFVIGGEVKYIGLTARVLRSRLSDYAHIKNSQTDRLRWLISEAISNGSRVEIYGWRQRDEAILTAEEARLRALHRPPWNRI